MVCEAGKADLHAYQYGRILVFLLHSSCMWLAAKMAVYPILCILACHATNTAIHGKKSAAEKAKKKKRGWPFFIHCHPRLATENLDTKDGSCDSTLDVIPFN